jgi:FkbM family methyltransferase
VYAFEPAPGPRQRLLLNIALNNLQDQVAVLPSALGDHNGEIGFYLPDSAAANQGVGSKLEFHIARSTIRIQQETLDTWASQNALSRLDFLKMDIQGGERDLLIGGQITIERFQPLIFCEASLPDNCPSPEYLEKLQESFVALGYMTSLVGEHGNLEPVPNGSPKIGNWLCVHRSKAQQPHSSFNF